MFCRILPNDKFRLSSLSVAILTVSLWVGHQAQANDTLVGEQLTTSSVNDAEQKNTEQKTTLTEQANQSLEKNQSIFDTDNYIYEAKTADDSNTNTAVTLQLNSQFSNKINTQVANQTLTDFDNFNQPTATFENNQVVNNSNNPTSANSSEIDKKQVSQPSLSSQQSQQNIAAVNQTQSEQTYPEQKQSIDTIAITNNQNNQTSDVPTTDVINPDDYLPEYQQNTATLASEKLNSTVTADKKSLLSKVKNRVLNTVDGTNYIDISFANADAEKQPAKNIKASLEQVTVESVSDFNGSINRLRQLAIEASEAVGYYDTKVSFKHLGGDNIEVSLDVGEPVKVQHRLVDMRGEGAEGDTALPVYTAIENDSLPKVGDVFNQGIYEMTKANVEGISVTNGFFDGKWLNNSVDVILPDNVADVDLVYDTQKRYHFGDIKVYSIDDKGNLTDDPDKLPIKPELLQKLMPYQKGDPYYQPFVTQLSNNLSVTRYFNGVNVDVILPITDGGTITSQATDENTTVETSDNHADTDQANIQNPEDYAPIDFNVDDTTQERLEVVKAKSRILLQAPEDMELAPEETNNSKNPLVIVANAVSNLAKKIDKNQNENDKKVQQAIAGEPFTKLTAEQVAEQKSIPTYIVLDASKPHEAEVGLGYETDVGVRAVAKMNNNLVNRHGYQAGISAAVSQVDQTFEVTGNLPYKHPINDKFTGSLGYQHKQSDKLAETFEVETLYANLARNIHQETGWDKTLSMRYRSDKLSLAQGQYNTSSLPYPFNNYASDFTQESLLFGYAMHKTQADNILNPTKGFSQRYSIEVGSDGLLTDTNLAILRAGATGLYSFGNGKKHQVLGRMDLGYIYSENFFEVPYRLRFFAGGDQSIRGFNTDTLAPTYGDQKFLMGGDTLAVGSLEYNYEFRDGLRFAMFSDVGNAYDTTGEADNKTNVGLGAGIRWTSPVGLVRLDVATGVTADDNPIRIHFFIGSPL